LKPPEHLYDPTPADPIALVAPFLEASPDWFIIGGLGDGLEWCHARWRWPTVKLIGVDPDPRAIQAQRVLAWPEESPLLEKALWYGAGRWPINMGDLNHASMHAHAIAGAKDAQSVECLTLSQLNTEYGPFANAVLWLDVEGCEYEALTGGQEILAPSVFALVNIEVRHVDRKAYEVYNLLDYRGYERAYVWFRQWWGHNEVWVPRGSIRP